MRENAAWKGAGPPIRKEQGRRKKREGHHEKRNHGFIVQSF